MITPLLPALIKEFAIFLIDNSIFSGSVPENLLPEIYP